MRACNNPHNKPILYVTTIWGKGTKDEIERDEILCPFCDRTIDDLIEPHEIPLRHADNEKAYIQFNFDFELQNGPPPENWEKYGNPPNDAYIGSSLETYDRLWNLAYKEKFMCKGPSYSEACSGYIGVEYGPIEHQKCNEECYCHCHYASCCCPDLDSIDPKILAIVCPIHGHVYSKTTTHGLAS